MAANIQANAAHAANSQAAMTGLMAAAGLGASPFTGSTFSNSLGGSNLDALNMAMGGSVGVGMGQLGQSQALGVVNANGQLSQNGGIGSLAGQNTSSQAINGQNLAYTSLNALYGNASMYGQALNPQSSQAPSSSSAVAIPTSSTEVQFSNNSSAGAVATNAYPNMAVPISGAVSTEQSGSEVVNTGPSGSSAILSSTQPLSNPVHQVQPTNDFWSGFRAQNINAPIQNNTNNNNTSVTSVPIQNSENVPNQTISGETTPSNALTNLKSGQAAMTKANGGNFF